MKNEIIPYQAALYVRVSTQEQANEGYSIQAQLERLRAYCVARGWAIANEYVDPGYSGAKLERPAIQKLIYDIVHKKNHTDIVVVFKLDRLSRSQKDTLYLIEDVFLKNNINFISMNESFDTTTPYGVAMIGILSAFAQLERENIKLRTQIGLQERAKDGFWRGGAHTPIGYKYDRQSGIIKADPYEATQIREIFDMFVNKHYSATKIGKIMAERYPEHAGTYIASGDIVNILKRRTYIGDIPWKGDFYKGRHEPLISQELFNAAQKLLAQRKPEGYANSFRANFLLTGIIWCARCGARYYAVGAYRGSKKLPCSQRKMIHAYMCYSRSKTAPRMIRDPNCKNDKWPTENLDQYVLKELRRLRYEPDYFQEIAAQNHPEPMTGHLEIKARILEIEQQIEKLLDLYQLQNIPFEMVSQRLESMTHEREALEQQLDDEQSVGNGFISIDTATQLLNSLEEVFQNGSFEEKRYVIHTLIKRIDLDGKNVKITWNFA